MKRAFHYFCLSCMFVQNVVSVVVALAIVVPCFFTGWAVGMAVRAFMTGKQHAEIGGF